MRVTQVSNGAVVVTRLRGGSAPHVLVVAGQHGNEPGPVLAMAGWDPARSNVTVVSLANPLGFALDWRFTEVIEGGQAPAHEIDMNRMWGVDGSIASEIWAAVLDHLDGRVPDIVLDLHSSPSHARDRGGLGHLVIASRESTRASLSLPIVKVLRSVEPEWAIWSPLFGALSGIEIPPDDFAGTLVDWASRCGAQAVTVEFADDFPAERPVDALPGESIIRFANAPIRRRTLQERMVGVRVLLDWIETIARG